MIQFNKLELSPQNDILLNIQVKDSEYYKDVYIDKIVIDTQDTYKESGPSDSPIFKTEFKDFEITGSSTQIQDIIPEFINDDNADSIVRLNLNEKNLIKVLTAGSNNLKISSLQDNLADTEYWKHPMSATIYTNVEGVRCEVQQVSYSENTVGFENFELVVPEDSKETITDIYIILYDGVGRKFDFSGDVTYTFSGALRTYRYKNHKSVDLLINNNELLTNKKDNIFFVYVITRGTPAPNTPCGQDNSCSLGVLYSLCKLYKYSIKYIKEVELSCSIPKDFINFILLYNALKIALKSGYYKEAIKYWNRLFSRVDKTTQTSCNCYGRST